MKTGPPQMAVVTGSSSGIGFEISLLLARKGVYTHATMRNLSKSEEILNYAKKENLPLETLVLDVIDARSISNSIQKIINERGGIDVLVNNAGYSLLGPLEQLQINEIKDVFETNFFGVIKLIQSVLPTMRKQRYGRIINVSSVAGRIGFPLSSAYVSSKFALEGLTESLRYEVQKFGIHAVLIEPGVIKTNFANNLRVGKNVKTLQDIKGINCPYAEITEKRISALRPRIEKGLPPSKVAEVIVEAVISDNPEARYLVGEAALTTIEKRNNTSDEQFNRFLMDSVLSWNSRS
jgi:NAD(P)-dependent dehydrogenase (short-subunit alcohol dehydrogenase family)